MRALVCHSPDAGIEGLHVQDVAPPRQDPGSVRILVHAAGVNFADTLIVSERYQVRPTPPFSPGMEIAGEIAELGAEVVDLHVGQRVAALVDFGGFAEQVVARAVDVVPMPDRIEPGTAAGLLVTYATAHLAVGWQNSIRPALTALSRVC